MESRNGQNHASREQVERALAEVLGRDGGHVDSIALSRSLDGDLPGPAVALVEAHLATCPMCRKERAAMRRGRARAAAGPERVFVPNPAGPPPARKDRRPRPLLFPALAGAVATAVVLALLWAGAGYFGDTDAPAPHPPTVAMRPPDRDTPLPLKVQPHIERPGTETTPPVRLYPRNDVEGSSVRRTPAPGTPAPGTPEPGPRAARPTPRLVPAPKPGPPPPPPEPVRPEGTSLLASLPDDPARLPEWARADRRRLDASPPTFRGATIPPPGPVTLLVPDPSNRGLEAERPGFAWAAVDGATAYRVRLITDPTDIDEEPRTLADAEVTVPRYVLGVDLPPGTRCVLEVQPVSAETPSGPAGAFRFRALSSEERRQAAWARANAGKNPVTAAMVLYRLGRLAEANGIAQGWSEGERTDRWKAALAQAVERRRQDPGR